MLCGNIFSIKCVWRDIENVKFLFQFEENFRLLIERMSKRINLECFSSNAEIGTAGTLRLISVQFAPLDTPQIEDEL